MSKAVKIITKVVTNNLVDVFWGSEGWDRKEWVRMRRDEKTWTIRKDFQWKVNPFEVEHGKVIPLAVVLPQIIKVCCEQYPN